MRLETIDNLAALKELAAAWHELPLPSPMQSPDWLLSWWESYGEEEPAWQLSVLALWDGERLVGLAPFYTQRHRVLGTTLRWLGDGRASTDHQTILVHSPEDEPAVVSAVARWIVDGASHRWHRLRLEAVEDNNRAIAHLERLLDEAGLDTERITDLGSFPTELAPTWDDYLATLSKNRRKKFRRWQREWFDTGRAVVRVATTEADRQAMWPDLVRLHAERREGMGEQGVFDCLRFNQFHQQTSADLLAQGELYLALLELDGNVVAVEYAPQDRTTIYAYQGGISASALALDAGHLSLMALAQHAIRTGRMQLDLLRGDEPYKLSWGAEHLPASTLHARPRTLAGTLERWAGNAYRGLRDARRRHATAAN